MEGSNMDNSTEIKKSKIIYSEMKTDKSKIDKLISAISVGAPITTALDYALISHQTYYDWVDIVEQYTKIIKLNILDNIKTTNNVFSVETINVCEQEGIDTVLLERLLKTPAYATPYCEIIERVKEAQAEVEVYHLNKIKTADKTTGWQASAWWLERRRNSEYGKQFVDNGDKTVKVEAVKVQFVDPKIDEDRVKAMEELVKNEVEGIKK